MADSTSFEKNTIVVGSGYWGKNLVRNFYELGALHGICETDPERLSQFAEQYEGIREYHTFQEALDDGDIPNIAIATPAETHYELVSKALNAGKNVFVEKPLALTFSQGKRLVDKAVEKNRVLFVGHLLEYHPAVDKLAELVADGELGELHYIYSNRLNLGKFRHEENILWSFAPHDISVILKLLHQMPIEVSCYGGSYLQPNIADTTVTNMVFESGSRAHIFVSWLHPFKEQKLVVIGSKKMAVFNDVVSEGKLMLYDQGADWVDNRPVPRKKEGEPVDFEEWEPLKEECRAFLADAEAGRRPVTDGYNGLRVLKVLQASSHSLQTGGKPVPIYESYEALNANE